MADLPHRPRVPIHIEWPPRVGPDAPRRRRVGWRLVVDLLGRVFITLGLLLFGFVAYQLWGTGIQQARAQDKLQKDFRDALVQTTTLAPAVPPTTTTVSSPTTTATGSASSATSAPGAEPSPTVAAVSPTTAAPVSGGVKEGDPVARLIIPKINVDQVVVSGVGVDDLKKGPGHYPDTPLPGEQGNAAIAGHRSTFGAPLARVDELDKGDEIDVTTRAGRFVFTVVDTRVVEPTEVSVIANTPDVTQLTLTSCWPKFSADKRIIIRALLDVNATAAGSAPATPTSTAPATPTTAGASTSAPAATTTVAGTSPTTTASVNATRSNAAFQQGWWSDDKAWGGVLAWGGGLLVLSWAAWRLSRLVHRNWVGALVGIGPFLVLLYFFYENVARLLPPNI